MQKVQKNGFGIAGIILIIAAVAVLGGGYWYWQAHFKIPPEIPPELQTQNNTIDTSNWKTYRNDKYGFEVRYPERYKIYQESQGISIRPIDGSYPYPFIEVSDLALQKKIENTADKIITDEEIKKDGIAGRKIIEEMAIGGRGLNYFFFHNNRTYLLRGTNMGINQMMFSTFKFIK